MSLGKGIVLEDIWSLGRTNQWIVHALCCVGEMWLIIEGNCIIDGVHELRKLDNNLQWNDLSHFKGFL